MNNITYFGRNNFPIRQGNSNFLTSSSSNYQKNRENMNYSQEVTIKKNPNIITKNRNDNIKKTPKYENNINLIIDCKKYYKKNPKIISYDLNFKKNYSFFEKNEKFSYINSKINVLETEPNKINNNNIYSKLNQTKNKNNYNEIFSNNNKPSTHILSTYYNNKNQINKNSIKKKNNNNINFNYNSPKANDNIKYNNNNVKNMNLKNNINNSNNSKNKYQSFTNINKIINKDFPYFPELLKEKGNLTKIKSEISIKNRKRNENQNNNPEANNLNLRRPLSSFSSDIYLKTENNINIRNNSYNNKFNTNYNLINIVSPKERKNTYTNINSMGKEIKFNYQNYINLVSSHKKSNDNKKIKDNYSFNQNDIKFDKICLNKFYEEAFNDSNNDKNMNIKSNNKNNKFENADDIIYKDNLTTNQSTYTNGSNKIKNLKKSISTLKQNNMYGNEKIENFEELHYFIISYIQNGKKAEKKFN